MEWKTPIGGEFISQKEIAEMLHYSVQTIIKKRKQGLINSRQFCPGGRVFIDRRKFLEEDMPRLITLHKEEKL